MSIGGCKAQPVRHINSSSYATNAQPVDGSQLEYVLFGVFCGECSGHCATMYRYNTIGHSFTLWVDTTDSYFTNKDSVHCKTPVTNAQKMALADSIVQQIPDDFLTTIKSKETFGCPDCTDGCGIYLELGEAGGRKQFYIDYQTEKLPQQVRTFAESFKRQLFRIQSIK